MKIDLYTKIVLTILTVFVGILVFRDVDFVTKAQANELDLSALKVEQSSNNGETTFFIYDNSKLKQPFQPNRNTQNSIECEIYREDIPSYIITNRKIERGYPYRISIER